MMNIKVFYCAILILVALVAPCFAQEFESYDQRELSIWSFASGDAGGNVSSGFDRVLSPRADWRARITGILLSVDPDPDRTIGLQSLGLGELEANTIGLLADVVVNRRITLTLNF